jgi:hypothetical protein
MKNLDHKDKFFFLLSGENPELAIFEFESILSTLDVPVKLRISSDNRVISFQILHNDRGRNPSEVISFLMKRVTLVHFCCLHFFQADFIQTPPVSFDELISYFDITTIQDLTPGTTFSVVTKRLANLFLILLGKMFSKEQLINVLFFIQVQ